MPTPLPVKVDATTGLIVEEKMTTAEIVEKVKAYVDSKEKKVFFNGKRYPEIDDWEYIATFYGLKLKTFNPSFVEIDGKKGFKAQAAVYDEKQNEVGRGESYCMNDEPNWRAKPLFQLASMAQTRAGAKAYANLFRPIARMCAMETSPVEEMHGEPDAPLPVEKKLPEPPPPPPVTLTDDDIDAGEETMTFKVAAKAPPIELGNPPPGSEKKCISEKQTRLIWFLMKQAKIPDNVFNGYIKDTFQVAHPKDLDRIEMDATMKWIRRFSEMERKTCAFEESRSEGRGTKPWKGLKSRS